MCQAESARDFRRGFLAGLRPIIIFERYANAKCVALGHAHLNLMLNGKHVNHSGEQSFGFVASRRGADL
jgi:hypothetical protein